MLTQLPEVAGLGDGRACLIDLESIVFVLLFGAYLLYDQIDFADLESGDGDIEIAIDG